jgi:transposase
MHVAKITTKNKNKTYDSYLIRQTYRDKGKVKHRNIANISKLPIQTIMLIKDSLQGKKFLSMEDGFRIVRTLPHGHVAAVLGTLRKLNLDKIIASKSCRNRDLVIAMIVLRIIQPQSKLATSRLLSPETTSSSLGKMLKLEDVDEDELYAAMDWLLKRQNQIEKRLGKKHLKEGSVVLYDLTSVYMEGTQADLADYGYNRDRKKGKQQVVFGLLCTKNGCPVAVKVFHGKTKDHLTLEDQLRQLIHDFGLKHVILVGDRGMITETQIRNELHPMEEVSYITALRAASIRSLKNQGVIELSLFDHQQVVEVSSLDYPNERLIVCKNPFLAEERRQKRESLLQATELLLNKIVEATQRSQRPLRDAAEIGKRVGKVLNKYKVAKHFITTITDTQFEYHRDEENIREEAELDGYYVIRTDVTKDRFDSTETVQTYKQLSVAERAFRTMKQIGLHVRPIYHWLDDRIRSHILICMLAYYVQWHMMEMLSPLLFKEDHPEEAKALHTSVVTSPERTVSTKKKIQKRRTEDGLPIHSFATLLEDLTTIAMNEVDLKVAGGIKIRQITDPTLSQNKVFELLGISHTM